jgi:hypothetical protein
LEVLSLWPSYSTTATESTHYVATTGEISEVGTKNIKDITRGEVHKILEFLTLRSESLLRVEDKPAKCTDLPVWEHRKRTTRYSIKPLIKVGDAYLWGPYSARQSSGIWSGVPHANRLPADFKAKSVQKVLQEGHRGVEESLVVKVEEIVSRFTPLVICERSLHKIDRAGAHPPSLGDYDVLAMPQGENILLNIECKIMDPPFCLKDARRLRERIFGRKKTNGTFQEGYLQKVERRADHLSKHANRIIRALGWSTAKDQAQVISIFVTQLEFWWTRFPPVSTEVKFVQIRTLHDLLYEMLATKPAQPEQS